LLKLVHHLNGLRALRIDNISETLDVEGRKNQLEKANNKLCKEIVKLNRLIEKLKQKQKMP
jgi:cell division protein FtsB